MRDVTSKNFGLLIAYLIPGFTVLWGLSHISPTVANWLGSVPEQHATVGGFLYVTIASVTAGMTVSTVRWVIIDNLHHRTGIKPPNWDFNQIASKGETFGTLIEIHYKYFQHYANMLIAVPIATCMRWSSEGFSWQECLFVIAIGVLFYAGSRDSLRKYYNRVESLLTL